MILSEALEEVKTIFLDTAPVIYFIEAHDQFGPLIKQIVNLMNENRIQAFTSVLTLSEVLPKPLETGNDKLAEKFKTYEPIAKVPISPLPPGGGGLGWGGGCREIRILQFHPPPNPLP